VSRAPGPSTMSSPDDLATARAPAPTEADPELDAVLAGAVRHAGRVGASLEALWHAAIAVDPELATAVDRRQRLAAALERLVAAGAIRQPPAGRNTQDRSATPWLPLLTRAVTAPKAPRTAPPALPAVLLPELVGANRLVRPRADEIATLTAVNEFLRDLDPARPAVPARERSLEIFGDEKRLDALVSQRLFTEGVLSYDLLRCYEVHPPFVFTRISDSPTALVIENHHTYDSARRELERRNRGIGIVAYGAGRAFCASVTYLADLVPAVKTAYYFGDLDTAGLQIPSAAQAAQGPGAVPVVPAVSLYRALLSRGVRRSGAKVAPDAAVALVEWLPEDLRAEALSVLTSGCWLAQEAVGLEVLAGLGEWL